MGMAMDTATVQKVRKSRACIAGILIFVSLDALARTEVVPFVEGELTQTDNVDLSASDEESSLVTSLVAGVSLQSEGNEGSASLDYSARQLFYSHDSARDSLYNELELIADKQLFSQTALRVDASAGITNIARNQRDNASDDVIRGDTIETIDADIGLSYQNNPASLSSIYARVDASTTKNEDGVGDYDNYGADVRFANGRSARTLYWLVNYNHDTNKGRDSGEKSQSHIVQGNLGLQQVYGFSPLVNYYLEEYSGESSDDSADSSSWGPALRYYWHKRSYVEVGYNFSIDGDVEDDWSSAIHINPTSRTMIHFEYKQRFYGDAYDFSLEHTNRRVKNTISYTETVENYNRDLFLPGESIEELQLTRTLSWVSTLTMKRSSASLELRTEEEESVNNLSLNTDSESYGSTISYEHYLAQNLVANISFDFDFYEFKNTGQSSQFDYYREWELGIDYDPVESLTIGFTLEHNNRSSTSANSEYKENSINLSVRKEF